MVVSYIGSVQRGRSQGRRVLCPQRLQASPGRRGLPLWWSRLNGTWLSQVMMVSACVSSSRWVLLGDAFRFRIECSAHLSVHCQCRAGEPSDSQDMLNTVQLDLLPTRSRRKELAVPALDRGPMQINEGDIGLDSFLNPHGLQKIKGFDTGFSKFLSTSVISFQTGLANWMTIALCDSTTGICRSPSRSHTLLWQKYGSKRLNTPVFRRSWKTQQVHCIGFGTGASAAAGGAVDGRARCKQRQEDNDKDATGRLKFGELVGSLVWCNSFCQLIH